MRIVAVCGMGSAPLSKKKNLSKKKKSLSKKQIFQKKTSKKKTCQKKNPCKKNNLSKKTCQKKKTCQTCQKKPQSFDRWCEGFCSTGRCLTSSRKRVCYTRVQPSPSRADRCRGDDPEHSGNLHCASDCVGNLRGSVCGSDPGTEFGDH